jgi:Flp pilus assembly protein TadG
VQPLSGRAAPGHLRARRDRESGQALLELALVVPILALLVMAIFQFAFVIESQMGLTNAVREAARRTVASTSTNPNWATLRAWTVEQLVGNGGSNAGLLSQNVQAYNASELWATYPTVTFCSYDAAGVENYRVTIEVKYKHPVFFGVLSFATDALDGTANNKWDLSASAEMRMENVDPGEVNATGTPPGAC